MKTRPHYRSIREQHHCETHTTSILSPHVKHNPDSAPWPWPCDSDTMAMRLRHHGVTARESSVCHCILEDAGVRRGASMEPPRQPVSTSQRSAVAPRVSEFTMLTIAVSKLWALYTEARGNLVVVLRSYGARRGPLGADDEGFRGKNPPIRPRSSLRFLRLPIFRCTQGVEKF